MFFLDTQNRNAYISDRGAPLSSSPSNEDSETPKTIPFHDAVILNASEGKKKPGRGRNT